MRRRLVPLVFIVIALLAIVALAAGGRPLGSSEGRSSGLPTIFWDYVFTTVVIVFVISTVVSLVAYLFISRETVQQGRRRRRSTGRSVFTVLAMCLLIAFIARHVDLHHLFHPNDRAANPIGKGHKGRKLTNAAPAVHFQWPELAVILGVFLLLSVLAARRSRLPSPFALRQGAPEALAAALDESLDDLRAESDLRRAIIAAYARMESALAAAGLPRRPAEAPLEYVERALLELDTSAAAVRRLTDLFVWARFSHHEPEPAMRDEAIDALEDVRDELRGAERVPA
jgi:hypothetical protein